MGDVVDLHGRPTHFEDDHELVSDFARFSEGILDEKFIRRKYRFDEDVWKRLGNDDAFVEKIENEKLRRIRSGAAKRELAQQHVVKAPAVLESIMMDNNASPKHRIDSAKVLDGFAANGPEAAPAADRFIIQINLGEDVLKFSKSIKPDANDIDPFNDNTSQDAVAAITTKNPQDNDDGGHI
jgi:hypothetical protein